METKNEDTKRLRIVLIGMPGVGKSALGNILIGEKKFRSSLCSESVTEESKAEEANIDGKLIRVVDTPGIIDTYGHLKTDEVLKVFDLLKPGPHAILITMMPGRVSENEKKILDTLKSIFKGETFLKYTLLVFTRKNDVIEECPGGIHDFIANHSADVVKGVYEKCGKRAVAVENKGNETDRKKSAEDVFQIIDKMDGFFDHDFFKVLGENNTLESKVDELKTKIEKLSLKNTTKLPKKEEGCAIL